MKGCKQGHSEILSSFGCIPENSEHLVAESIIGDAFSAYISAREMWTGKVAGEEVVIIDGLKVKGKVRGGVLYKQLSVKHSFRISDHYRFFRQRELPLRYQ